jgi:hypothetical protein
VLLDDQSKPDVTRSLYEKLITVEEVDLLRGPYATSGILAAMGVAQRYGKVFVRACWRRAGRGRRPPGDFAAAIAHPGGVSWSARRSRRQPVKEARRWR